MPLPVTANTALVLTGGGARAAYQVGVLKAVAELLPTPPADQRRNPFPILCGTSAGAINAAVLASFSENFDRAVEGLIDVWQNIHADQVYRANALGIATTGARWLGALMFGWLVRRGPRSLLDSSPLRQLLARHVDLTRIEQAIAKRSLRALSITCSGYTSGQSVTFYQGSAELMPWIRFQRRGVPTSLQLDHLMASSAIPFIFPAVKLNREYFGDGSMRQLSPIAPAIHLGAEKILVIGAGRMVQESDRQNSPNYPSLAQIAGHALSSIFLDSLSMDLERLNRINQTLAAIPQEARNNGSIQLRPIDVLVISPSERLDDLAARHATALPRAVRTLLGGIGAMNRGGGALTSYLLFEPAYTQALIDLGYRDALARAEDIRDFFGNLDVES